MNKRTASSLAVVSIITFTAAIFLIHNEISNLQMKVNDLQNQKEELEKQTSNLQSQIAILEQQNGDIIKQMGDLTKQLALQRHLRIEIVSLWHSGVWSAYGGLLVSYPFNVTVRNNDQITVSGLTLTVQAFSGLKDETQVPGLSKIDLLQAGEERVISGEVVVYINAPWNLTYVATLKAGDIVIDTFTSP